MTSALSRAPIMAAQAALFLAVGIGYGSMDRAQAAANNSEYGGQPNLAQIHVTKELHDSFAGKNLPVVIAILDGYADTNHFDLKDRLSTIIVYKGTYDNRRDEHATHISGIAGAAQNGMGVVGVDPFATLINIPLFDSKGRWVAQDNGEKALDAARTAGARVVNMSYGPTAVGDVFLNGELDFFPHYNSTTPGQGMVLVKAAGNDGKNAKNE